MLPKFLQDLIWRHYRPGQEVDKRPSRKYIQAANAVQLWIEAQNATIRGRALTAAHKDRLLDAVEKELRSCAPSLFT